MIKLSNKRQLDYVVASGALGFDGKGWFWEKPLIWLGLIYLPFFTVVLRTLTRQPRLYPVSNLSWWRPWTWLPFSPWSCVRFLPDGGVVNKVGFYNPGFDWWLSKVAPRLNFRDTRLIVSIAGTAEELAEMARALNNLSLTALELNVSCPNSGHPLATAETVIKAAKLVWHSTHHPIIIKVSADQPYLAIAQGLADVAEAVSLNSVPWKKVFPNQISPLWRLEKNNDGGGGVSGGSAQHLNWLAVRELAQQGSLPVIGASPMNYSDVVSLRAQGAQAISFGAIHLKNPCLPTAIVRQEKQAVSAEARKDLYHADFVEYPTVV